MMAKRQDHSQGDEDDFSRKSKRFIRAAWDGDEELVLRLLEDGMPVDIQEDGKYLTALAAAAEGGHTRIMRLLLERGAAVQGVGHYYPLVYAARGGQLEATQLLVENGAEVNAFIEGFGPAHFDAAARGHLAILQYLLEHGADPNIKNGFGQTAISQADRSRRMAKLRREDTSSREAAIEMLREAGAKA